MPELTVERLFSDPPLFGGVPQNPRFTPDGRYAAFLRLAPDDRERLDLWRVDLETGALDCWVPATRLGGIDAGPRTEAERAERERRRQFAGGITAFAFSPDGRRLLLPVEGTAFVLDIERDELAAVTPAGTRQTDIRFSPDGRQLSYVRDGDLYRYDLDEGREVRLTADGGGIVSNGLADFIAQEEMHRFEGYWWSPDARYLAFTRVDESPVAVSQRFEVNADEVTTIPQRYPYAGADNADVRLIVLDVTSGDMTEIAYRQEQDDYLARVAWLGARLAVQRQSRDQQTLELTLFDADGGNAETVLRESSATWINLHDNFMPLPDPDRGFLWTSERTGASHLYVYRNGALQPMTSGAGRVNRVLWTDGRNALVTGWIDSPTEQHLFLVPVDEPGPVQRLTGEAAWHEPVVDSGGQRVLDRLSSLDVPGRLDLLTLAAGAAPRPRVLVEERIDADHPYAPYRDEHVTPELGVLTAEDGQRLHFRLTRPSGPAPEAGYPVIVHVYGGPGVQRVRNEWPPMVLQLLARRGYGVLELDNRGSSNRDRRFEAPIYRQLGSAEVADQVRGARYLAGLPWVDAGRIGVFGHSYGGYMTLMCLLKHPETFKAGMSVAPVTDWTLYDTHYTERYLQTPLANPDGYRASAVTTHAAGLSGKLLLVHGMADDNVLFTHSTRLFRELQAHNLPFEMMAYPGSKHALQERDVSIHRFTLLLDFFGRNL